VREIDSILRLKNDEIGILGGLMEVRSHQNRSQIPGVGNVPLIGELVKGRADGDEVVELVILLKATIVEGAPAPDNADDRIYHEYTNDPRPF
jgi:type II secretory pathway component GspD/PulD (secretin)